MNKYLTGIFLALTLFSCHKLSDSNPNPVKGGTDNGGSTAGTYAVKFDVDDQIVNTRVSNDTLYLNYTEKASLLLNPDDYEYASAVHFKQDFSKSNLVNFHFITINKDNQVANDYLEDNLNNVTIKSASTVTVNGAKFTKLVLEREIIFSKAYKQAGLATEAQTDILKQTKDQISFSTYYYYDKKNSDTTTVTANLVYSKAN